MHRAIMQPIIIVRCSLLHITAAACSLQFRTNFPNGEQEFLYVRAAAAQKPHTQLMLMVWKWRKVLRGNQDNLLSEWAAAL